MLTIETPGSEETPPEKGEGFILHRRVISSLSHMTDADETRGQEPGARAAQAIGPYRLLEPIGEGDMGEVWLAEQAKSVRRKVALKIIKAGTDTAQVVARFMDGGRQPPSRGGGA